MCRFFGLGHVVAMQGGGRIVTGMSCVQNQIVACAISALSFVHTSLQCRCITNILIIIYCNALYLDLKNDFNFIAKPQSIMCCNLTQTHCTSMLNCFNFIAIPQEVVSAQTASQALQLTAAHQQYEQTVHYLICAIDCLLKCKNYKKKNKRI